MISQFKQERGIYFTIFRFFKYKYKEEVFK